MVGSCIALIFIAIFYESLKFLRIQLASSSKQINAKIHSSGQAKDLKISTFEMSEKNYSTDTTSYIKYKYLPITPHSF